MEKKYRHPVPRAILTLLSCLLLSQCDGLRRQPEAQAPRPSYRIYPERYEALKPKDSHLRIDLAAQKATLLNRDGEAVIVTDVSTGKPGHETPAGRFKVLEKLETKRSNLYGRYLDAITGQELGQSWTFESPPKGSIYEGFEMPYWMRLTHDGVGLHVGFVVPREAVSFGCIRVPERVQPMIYEKCVVGTRVEIVPGKAAVPAVTPVAATPAAERVH
jgi:hypothetical protein